MKLFLRLPVPFLLFLGFTINAQNTVPASGGNGSGTGGSASYTVGQIVYTYESGSNGNIEQGVQQPFEISVITGAENSDITLDITAFPNPVSEILTLKIKDGDYEKLSYSVYNITGNLIRNNSVLDDETQVNMQDMPSGTYILKVQSDKKELKVFKIIKH